jgi:heptosyltransferase-1
VRVLIVKTSSMGDIVHALPVVADIARAYPHARIDWVVEEAFADIVRLHPGVTRVHTVALRRWKKRMLSRASWRELLDARRALQRTRYHDIIDLQGLVKSALVARCARGPVTGFDRRSAREPLAALLYQRRIGVDRGLHAVERSRLLAAVALGYAVEGPPRFGLSSFAGKPASEDPAAPASGLAGEGGMALLFTNASRATKLWPDERWIALERRLAARGITSLLAWGSAAEGQATRARARSMVNARVLDALSISAIAALAASARVVVGLDTGLTHLAAAAGAPTLGLFCDYDPALVGLRGEGAVRSLGGVGGGPLAEEAIAAMESLLAGPIGDVGPR